MTKVSENDRGLISQKQKLSNSISEDKNRIVKMGDQKKDCIEEIEVKKKNISENINKEKSYQSKLKQIKAPNQLRKVKIGLINELIQSTK